MTSTVPASMGGPLSEAEAAATRIRAYLKACPEANDFGREHRYELRDAHGYPYALPRADLVAVLDALGVLEGQLATAQELAKTWLRNAENVRSSADRPLGLSKVEKAELKQGAIELEHCAHQLRNTLGLDGGGSDEV